jgi:hypothetical protein
MAPTITAIMQTRSGIMMAAARAPELIPLVGEDLLVESTGAIEVADSTVPEVVVVASTAVEGLTVPAPVTGMLDADVDVDVTADVKVDDLADVDVVVVVVDIGVAVVPVVGMGLRR